MSDTMDVEAPDDVAAPYEAVMPFDAFAAMLRPRVIAGKLVPGDPDEVWLKLLKGRAAGRRMTATQWRAEIDVLRGQPAHEADIRFVKGA